MLSYTPTVRNTKGGFKRVDDDQTTAGDIVAAQVQTHDLIGGFDDLPGYEEKEQVKRSFTTLTDPMKDQETKKRAALAISTPTGVRNLVGMLTVYDWNFVQQANEIRGYVVAKLLEESQGEKDASRLKALELLGKVTEIALFTERSEVKHVSLSDDDMERRIRDLIDITPEAENPDCSGFS